MKKFLNSDLFAVFNWKEDRAFGRFTILTSIILHNMVSHLALGGTLYTAFLMVNNFSIVDTGIISFLPALSGIFILISPILLERFQKRRWILAIGRSLYYGINIIGITLITLFVHDQQMKLVLFGVIVFLSNSCFSMISSGYQVWQMNFLPEEIRPRYFSYQQIISQVFSGLSLLVFGLIADAIRGTEQEFFVLTVLRVAGFVFAVLDVIIVSLPKEYSYPSTEEKVQLRHTFVLPLRNRKFLLTMAVIAAWGFSGNLTATWTYYLMNTVEIKVTVINMMDFAYIFWLFLMLPFWRKVLRKFSWFSTFCLCAIPVTLLTSLQAGVHLVPHANLFLFVLNMIIQPFSVGLNLAYSNFIYINMPKENQTYFMSFYLTMVNVVALLGQMTGTWLLHLLGDALPFFGMQLDSPAFLVLLKTALQLGVAIVLFFMRNKLQPDPQG